MSVQTDKYLPFIIFAKMLVFVWTDVPRYLLTGNTKCPYDFDLQHTVYYFAYLFRFVYHKAQF